MIFMGSPCPPRDNPDKNHVRQQVREIRPSHYAMLLRGPPVPGHKVLPESVTLSASTGANHATLTIKVACVNRRENHNALWQFQPFS